MTNSTRNRIIRYAAAKMANTPLQEWYNGDWFHSMAKEIRVHPRFVRLLREAMGMPPIPKPPHPEHLRHMQALASKAKEAA